jgi:excisionase family DNA binding protein
VSVKKSTPTAAPEFISLKDAASRTGFSVFTLRDKVNSGDLPAYRMSGKPGAQMRVKIADVDALLEPVIPPAIYAERLARQRHPLDPVHDFH